MGEISTDMTTALRGDTIYDDCRITSCLKKMFAKTRKSTAATTFATGNHIAEFKKELELLRDESVVETSYHYLKAMEASLPETAFRYVVIYKKNAPVLFGYFQLYTLTSENFYADKNKKPLKSIFHFLLDLKKIPVLIAGNALRTETAWYCYDKTVFSNEEAVEVLASAAEKIANEACAAAIIIKDIDCTASFPEGLAETGYEQPMQDVTMVMDIEPQWGSLAGYTAALSRKYKTRANKILASGGGLTIKALTTSDVLLHEQELNGLFKQVTGKQQFTLARPGKDHFSELKKIYEDSFEVFGFFKEDQLAAFYSAFKTDEAYEMYYVGFDYAMNSEYQLYFNILFAGLQRAIALKKKQLKLGRTSFDAKASMGAKAREMNYAIKIAGVPKLVRKWFVRYFSGMEDGKWKLRHPLKQDERKEIVPAG